MNATATDIVSPWCSDLPQGAVPLYVLAASEIPAWLAAQPQSQTRWARSSGFVARPGQWLALPAADGSLAAVLLCRGDGPCLWDLAALPSALPPGIYRVQAWEQGGAQNPDPSWLQDWALGWGIAAQGSSGTARLWLPAALQQQLQPLVAAVHTVRRLVNAPANWLGPEQLVQEVRALAQRHGATLRHWQGDALAAAGFAMVQAVGRAAAQAPQVAELRWGQATHPHLVLIGKGVCFDSGGLDLKPAAGMRWMKKDMGGAAHALALAELVMQARLPVQLTLLIPAVENAVGAGALRPGDVLQTAQGSTVEIENTDAEGRLLLADALAHALTLEPAPALLLDLATLTGAARMALGTEVPAFFCNDEALARQLADSAQRQADPLWRLPLWQPYREQLKSTVADLLNAASTPQGGAITAALFLQHFISASTPWLHIDLAAWNVRERPGRPVGGEAQGLRALFDLLQRRFA